MGEGKQQKGVERNLSKLSPVERQQLLNRIRLQQALTHQQEDSGQSERQSKAKQEEEILTPQQIYEREQQRQAQRIEKIKQSIQTNQFQEMENIEDDLLKTLEESNKYDIVSDRVYENRKTTVEEREEREVKRLDASQNQNNTESNTIERKQIGNYTAKDKAVTYRIVLNQDEINELIKKYNFDRILLEEYKKEMSDLKMNNPSHVKELNELTEELNNRSITDTYLERNAEKAFFYKDYLVSGNWIAEKREGYRPLLIIKTNFKDSVGIVEHRMADDDFRYILEHYKPDPSDKDDNDILLIVPSEFITKRLEHIPKKKKYRLKAEVKAALIATAVVLIGIIALILII